MSLGRSLKVLWPVALVVCGGLLLILVFPHMASAYHLEAAGRVIDEPGTAIVHLERALRWDSQNAQAYRLMGKAYQAQGDLEAGVAALAHYIELRPRNPLGHIELAEAYETLAAESGTPGQELDSQIGREWRLAGLNAEGMMEAAQRAETADEIGQAIEWYERAQRVEPDLADPWYQMGLLLAEQEHWAEALEAFQQAGVAPRTARMGRSSPHYRSGLIYTLRLEPRQPDEALAAFDMALEANDFENSAQAAETHYRRGRILRNRGAPAGEYAAAFEKAVELNPENTRAHTYLGISVYERDQDADTGESALLKALELSPTDRWSFYFLGEIYRQEGRIAEAADMYESALEIAPGFEAAQERLKTLQEDQ